MRVEVEHDSARIMISWWPENFWDSWIVVKRLDHSATSLPLPVLPAYIVPGSIVVPPATPAAAKEYAAELLRAARLAGGLDWAIREREGFQRVEIEEHDSALRVTARCENDPDGCTHWRAVVLVPDQSEYREREAQPSPTA